MRRSLWRFRWSESRPICKGRGGILLGDRRISWVCSTAGSGTRIWTNYVVRGAARSYQFRNRTTTMRAWSVRKFTMARAANTAAPICRAPSCTAPTSVPSVTCDAGRSVNFAPPNLRSGLGRRRSYRGSAHVRDAAKPLRPHISPCWGTSSKTSAELSMMTSRTPGSASNDSMMTYAGCTKHSRSWMTRLALNRALGKAWLRVPHRTREWFRRHEDILTYFTEHGLAI